MVRRLLLLMILAGPLFAAQVPGTKYWILRDTSLERLIVMVLADDSLSVVNDNGYMTISGKNYYTSRGGVLTLGERKVRVSMADTNLFKLRYTTVDTLPSRFIPEQFGLTIDGYFESQK